jgi:hypothetical protein
MDNFYALIVGVGGNGFDETVKDAEAIRDVLTTQGAYNSINTFFLTENKSTKDNIIQAFDKIITKTEETEDATVFIYYSGHGQRYETTSNNFNYYLRTFGADDNNKEQTMLNGDVFSDKVDKIKANRMLVMLDCCYAGGVKKLKTKGEEEIVYSNAALQEKLKKGRGRVFISSCAENETSVILPGSTNSLFTEVALEVLNGLFSQNREFVSVLDIVVHVLNDVPKKIEPFNHDQNPLLTEATNLSHKDYICKNGKWKPLTPKSTIALKLLNIDQDKITPNQNLSNFDDLDNVDKDIVNNFFEQINLENNIQIKDKVDFINGIGGLANLKKASIKIDKIKFYKTANETNHIDIGNILNIIIEHIDEQTKLDFIKNYKYKI